MPSNNLTFTLGEGFLISATAVCPVGTLGGPGAMFALLIVQRDLPEAQQYSWVLFSDYISDQHYPTWPYGRSIAGAEGPGRVRSIVGNTPAAGAEISETVPNGVRWLFHGTRFALTTSAVAGNRNTSIVIDDGVNILWDVPASGLQAASLTNTFRFFNSGTAGFISGTNQWQVSPFPLPLRPGFRIRTSTASLDVGDQYTSPKYLVTEWVET